MPLQNMLLWHKDDFELKAIEEADTRKVICRPVCLKAGYKFKKVPFLPSVPGITKITLWRQP